MTTCGGNTARQPVSSHCALRCDSGSFCANHPFHPRAGSSQRIPPYKETACLTGIPPISYIPDYKGQHPPG
jgi:hypothetical protein